MKKRERNSAELGIKSLIIRSKTTALLRLDVILNRQGYTLQEHRSRRRSLWALDDGDCGTGVLCTVCGAGCVGLEPEEAMQLYGLLYKVLNTEK